MSSEGWPIVLMMRLTPVCADSRRAERWEEREGGQCKRRPERREIPFVRHCQSRCACDKDYHHCVFFITVTTYKVCERRKRMAVKAKMAITTEKKTSFIKKKPSSVNSPI